MLKLIKKIFLGEYVRKKVVPFEVYLPIMTDWVVDRMNYHNDNSDNLSALAIGQEFVELFSEQDYEILFSIRIKEYM